MTDTTPTTAPTLQPTYNVQQRWEYHTAFHKIGLFNDRKKRDGWDATLAEAGTQGWELVQAMLVQGQGTRDGYHFIFKRPASRA